MRLETRGWDSLGRALPEGCWGAGICSGTPEQVGQAWGYAGHASSSSLLLGGTLKNQRGRREQDHLHLLHLWGTREKGQGKDTASGPGWQASITCLCISAVKKCHF